MSELRACIACGATSWRPGIGEGSFSIGIYEILIGTRAVSCLGRYGTTHGTGKPVTQAQKKKASKKVCGDLTLSIRRL